MRTLVLLVTVAALASCNAPANKKVSLTTFSDSASYAIGMMMGENVFGQINGDSLFSEGVDIDIVLGGMRSAFKLDSSQLSLEESQDMVQRFLTGIAERRKEENKVAGEKFLAENATKPGVVTTKSGLQYIALKEGEGKSPNIADKVLMHYTGRLLNGFVWSDTYERGEPLNIEMARILPGWQEALQLMKPGAEYKLFLPSDLAFGERGGPEGLGVGPNEVVLLDVKLIEITTQE